MLNMTNNLNRSVILIFTVIGILSLMFFLPELQIGGFTLKKINLYSDIQKKEKKNVVAKKIKQIYTDTCKADISCYEDFSIDNNMMSYFFNAIDSINILKKPIRIAYFGDSFIEGDLMTEDLRDTLQKLYSGEGVGFVPITSMVAGFRQTVRHSFANFKTYTVNDQFMYSLPIGIAGSTAIPDSGNYVNYKPVYNKRFLKIFHHIRLFYQNNSEAQVRYNVNSSQIITKNLEQGNGLQCLELNQDSVKSVTFRFTGAPRLYGVSFDSKEGIYVDNFATRGNSGFGLLRTPDKLYQSFDSLLNYKLVVIHYGLNVVSRNCKKYDWYKQTMKKAIEHIKSSFPRCSILLVSVSDRSTRIEGEYVTMPEIPLFIDTQRELAKETGVVFWNLFDAMGGENSIVDFANQKPPLANKDYTHLNYRGGRKIANIFTETLLFEKSKFDRKKSVEKNNKSL